MSEQSPDQLLERDYSQALGGEYSSLVQKMAANEAWAYSFVALYFAFLASLSIATGFIVFKNPETLGPQNVVPTIFGVSGVHLLATIFSALGILLNIWAIYMVLEYKRSAVILLRRLKEIELELGRLFLRFGAQRFGFADSIEKAHYAGKWKIGIFVVIGAVMFLIFVPWIIVILMMFK